MLARNARRDDVKIPFFEIQPVSTSRGLPEFLPHFLDPNQGKPLHSPFAKMHFSKILDLKKGRVLLGMAHSVSVVGVKT